MGLIIVGLLLLVIGAVTAHYTAGLVSTLSAIAAAIGLVLIVVGALLLFADDAEAAIRLAGVIA